MAVVIRSCTPLRIIFPPFSSYLFCGPILRHFRENAVMGDFYSEDNALEQHLESVDQKPIKKRPSTNDVESMDLPSAKKAKLASPFRYARQFENNSFPFHSFSEFCTCLSPFPPQLRRDLATVDLRNANTCRILLLV